MSNDILKSEFGVDQHPDENELLLALERELPPADVAAVERHIGTCWACRARYHEIHRGILAFVEYRDKLYLPELEPAPGDFRQFPSLLNKIAAEGGKDGLLNRIGSRLRSFFTFPHVSLQVRWVTATAVMMTAVLFWTQVLSPTSISASELLTKAAQAQNPPAATHRKIRQRVRVKSGKKEAVREFQWETGSPIPGAKWGTDPENWIAPMTAEGFSEWRNSLSTSKDTVKKSGDNWTLDTIAPAGSIKEASIVIHSGDFHPIEQHIRFADDRMLDVEEVSFEIAEQPPTAFTASQVSPPAPPVQTQSQPPAAAAPAANLDEAELELRYAMFLQRLDGDEDLQVSRAVDAVVLSGVASSAERLRQLRAALAGLRGVRLSISEPSSAVGGMPPTPSQRTANGSSVPLLKDRLDSAFPSVEARRDFVDSCLAASDSALSHAWALKRLADRYTDNDRRALKPESQTKLNEMLREHLKQLGAANATLNGLMDLVPASRQSRAETPTGWRPAVAALFDFVQQQDALVAAMAAGTQNNYSLATASERLRSAHDAIARLAGELKPPDVGIPPR
jgi:hypothetical protein